MDRVDRLAYIITRELQDRAQLEKMSRAEYVQVLIKVRDFCRQELTTKQKR